MTTKELIEKILLEASRARELAKEMNGDAGVAFGYLTAAISKIVCDLPEDQRPFGPPDFTKDGKNEN